LSVSSGVPKAQASTARVREAKTLGFFAGLFYAWVKRAVTKRLGRMIEPTQVMSNRPKLLWAYLQMTEAAQAEDLLEPRLKTLVFLRAAALIGCPF
jgi:hypothetical protein